MSGNTDPRIEALASAIRLNPVIGSWSAGARYYLTIADAADRAAGIVRLRVDDEAVERVAEEIRWQLAHYTLPANFPLNTVYHGEVAERCAPLIARAVLAALRSES